MHVDQIGNTTPSIPKKDLRIVSLVPSQTELLYDLGLEEEVVGITKFCVHPTEWRKQKVIVGGTKTVHIDKIKSLHPTLIIANKEENVKEQILDLQHICPVWTSDVKTVEAALEMIQSISVITDSIKKGKDIINSIKSSFNKIPQSKKKSKVAYVIWNNPIMIAGGDTFINDLLKRAGFDNAFAHVDRYPTVSIQNLIQAKLDYLLLSSEPFPFKEKHLQEFKQALPNTTVKLVDGELFSWYGSRMIKAAQYFQKIHLNY